MDKMRFIQAKCFQSELQLAFDRPVLRLLPPVVVYQEFTVRLRLAQMVMLRRGNGFRHHMPMYIPHKYK
jgi:hypothetical protein